MKKKKQKNDMLEKKCQESQLSSMFQAGKLSKIPNVGFKIIMKIKNEKSGTKKQKRMRERHPLYKHIS